MLIQGKDPSGKVKYANVTESGDLGVQLSGTKMKSLILVDKLAITDTSDYDFSVATTDIRGMSVFLISSLDAELNVRLNPYGEGYHTTRTFNGVEWKDEELLVIPSSPVECRYYLNTAFPYLDNLITPRFGIRISAKTTPTKGSVTVYIMGGIN